MHSIIKKNQNKRIPNGKIEKNRKKTTTIMMSSNNNNKNPNTKKMETIKLK